MIIKQIEITNFQSHRHTVIDLSEAVNVFQGTSDHGKTAIIRAIVWVLYNKSPNSLKHWDAGAKEAVSVSITLFDGSVIERRRTKSKNQYVVNGKVLNAIGRGVPEEVSDLINLTDLNLKKQFGLPFMVMDTGGTIARKLNEVVELDAMDITLSSAKTRIQKTKRALEVAETRQEELTSELEDFDGLEEVEGLVTVYEELCQSIAVSRKQEKDLLSLQASIKEIKDIDYSWVEPASKLLERHATAQNTLQQAQERKDALQRLSNAWDGLIREGKALDKTETEGIVELCDEWSELSQHLAKRVRQRDTFNDLVHKTSNATHQIKELNDELIKYSDLMPDVCDVCGSVISTGQTAD